SEAIDGLTVACNELGTPITGGNVSFYNETLGKSIYPTPVIGILGILEDASRVLKIVFRAAGDVVVLLDGANADAVLERASHAVPLQAELSSDGACEFSSSEYSKTIAGIVSGEPPAIDLPAEKRLIDCLVALASNGSLQSAHDISDGGIAVALAESCFAAATSPVGARHAVPLLGANVNLDAEGPAEHTLFNERGARCIVSVSPTKLAALLETARQYGVGAREIGKVHLGGALRIEYKGTAVIDSPLDSLLGIWANSLEQSLKVRS
ncbi:MAG: AIR synthase-related protein, partial [Candidatus Acidiferrum sp.]